jgi:hydroxycarboxylate dehydrogenase B
VIRVPVYVRWKKTGNVIPNQTPEIVVDTPSLAVVDGKFGYGQTVTPFAVRTGIDKCKKSGLSAVALRNAGHIGRVGDWAEMAAAEGLVSVYFVNAAGSLLVAPYGGVEKRLSTAPYCVGIPRAGADPIVLDFATSIVAEGKCLVASRGGKKLPAGALIDADGTLSQDPHVLYGPYTPDGAREHAKGTGAIRAFGEHKGSGLAVICELLGGALTGTGATAPNRRFANGMLAFYIDPKVVDPANFFDGEIARYVDFIRATKPGAGVDEVLIPGDPERKTRAERTRNGIPLPEDTWAAIVNTAREVGVSEVSIQRATS